MPPVACFRQHASYKDVYGHPRTKGFSDVYGHPRTKGPTGSRTQVAGFKVQSANHYTIEPGAVGLRSKNILLFIFLSRGCVIWRITTQKTDSEGPASGSSLWFLLSWNWNSTSYLHSKNQTGSVICWNIGLEKTSMRGTLIFLYYFYKYKYEVRKKIRFHWERENQRKKEKEREEKERRSECWG